MYYKEAKGAFIVFDLTRQKTFEAVMKWKQDIDSKVTLPSGKVIPIVLLANKVNKKNESSASKKFIISFSSCYLV